MKETDIEEGRLNMKRRGLLGTLGVGAGAVAGLSLFSGSALAWVRDDVRFLGCSELWIVVDDADNRKDPPTVADVIVETTDGSLDCRRQFFTSDSTTTIPGQFGDAPVLKYEVSSGEKVLGVVIYNYSEDHDGINPDIEHPLVLNPNRCANTPGTPDPSDAECAEDTYISTSLTIDGPGNGGSGGPPGNGGGRSNGNGK